VIRYFTDAHAGVERLRDAYLVWLARGPADRMSPSEIEAALNDYYLLPGKRADLPAIVDSVQGQVIPFISEILQRDEAVRSVLNIGSAIAMVDSYLAARFPHIEFTGVDLWADLHEINKELHQPNLRLVRGYALDLIEAGTLKADLVFTTSTATRMKNRELRRYLRAISKTARYVVLNEPLTRKPDGVLPDPNRLPLDVSEPIMIQPVYSGDKHGGLPPVLCHNYAAACEEAGFSVIYNRTVHAHYPRLWLVAQR
jgi:hypothetical protein